MDYNIFHVIPNDFETVVEQYPYQLIDMLADVGKVFAFFKMLSILSLFFH